jgi:hypothetical protein
VTELRPDGRGGCVIGSRREFLTELVYYTVKSKKFVSRCSDVARRIVFSSGEVDGIRIFRDWLAEFSRLTA